ncbi:MAG: hypothetical protein GY722_17550 [bacterium]|nr:hypothetical protein [bacterium]
MTEQARSEQKEPMYILYDPSSGRIFGRYSKFDSEQGTCVTCSLEEVKRESAGASEELSSDDFGVLEVQAVAGQELRDLRVDPKARKLVPRGKTASARAPSKARRPTRGPTVSP